VFPENGVPGKNATTANLDGRLPKWGLSAAWQI